MLTIGEFSRLCHVTPRTLRHYDALGLLRPVEVGENSYRYYTQEQLRVLARIQWLRGYGFSLGEIGLLLELDDWQLAGHLRKRRQALRAEQANLQTLLRQIDADILLMEGKPVNEVPYRVILLNDPEQKIFSIRETVGVAQYHDLFVRLRQEAQSRGLTQAGPIQMCYRDPEFSYESADVEAQMVVSQNGPDVFLRPACTCAAVQHRGPYENLHRAYEALCAWMGEHPEYHLCGPVVDRYLNDPHETPPDQLLTGVLFPVERIPGTDSPGRETEVPFAG